MYIKVKQFTFVGVSLSESFYGNLWEFTSKLFFFILNHLHHEHANLSFLQIISLSLLNSVLDWLRFPPVSLIPALCHTCNLLPDHVLNQQINVMIHHIVHTTCNYQGIYVSIVLELHTCYMFILIHTGLL